MERRIRKWDENLTRLDANRLVKVSRDNILAGRRSPRSQKGEKGDKGI